jgi:hypothetical protein
MRARKNCSRNFKSTTPDAVGIKAAGMMLDRLGPRPGRWQEPIHTRDETVMLKAPLLPRGARWAPSASALAALALALALAASVTVAPARAAPDSAYSTIAWDTGCTVIDQPAPDEPGGWAVLRCQGLAGVPVVVSDSDGRMSVWYGQGGEGHRGWASFTGFNEVNDTIEWRGIVGSGQGPYAAIHRWFVDDGRQGGGKRQVLVVSTVAMAPGEVSCPAGYVDANANGNANVLARQVADQVARGFRCGRQQAMYHGLTTAATPTPSVSGF